MVDTENGPPAENGRVGSSVEDSRTRELEAENCRLGMSIALKDIELARSHIDQAYGLLKDCSSWMYLPRES